MTTDLAFTLWGRGQNNWSYVYAHKAAEALLDTLNPARQDDGWCAPDLIAANHPRDSYSDGIYDCTVIDRPAKLFIWSPRSDMRKGLVVLIDDAEGVADAQRGYDQCVLHL